MIPRKIQPITINHVVKQLNITPYILKRLALLYLSLTYDTKTLWPSPQHSTLTALETVLRENIMDYIKPPQMPCDEDSREWIGLDVNFHYLTPDLFSIIISVECNYYFDAYISFIHENKKYYGNPVAIDFFKKIFSTLAYTHSSYTLHNFYELWSDTMTHEEKESAEELNWEYKHYKKILKDRPYPSAQIESAFKKIKPLLNTEQIAWTEKTIELLTTKLSCVPYADQNKYKIYYKDADERMDLGQTFPVLYDPNSSISEWIIQYFNESAGNYGLSLELFEIHNKQDLERVKERIRLLTLQQWIHHTLYDTWS